MSPAIEAAASENIEPRPLKLRILRAAPIVVILGLLIHLLLPRLDTITDSLQTLRSMRPWAVVIALLMESLSYVLPALIGIPIAVTLQSGGRESTVSRLS